MFIENLGRCPPRIGAQSRAPVSQDRLWIEQPFIRFFDVKRLARQRFRQKGCGRGMNDIFVGAQLSWLRSRRIPTPRREIRMSDPPAAVVPLLDKPVPQKSVELGDHSHTFVMGKTGPDKDEQFLGGSSSWKGTDHL